MGKVYSTVDVDYKSTKIFNTPLSYCGLENIESDKMLNTPKCEACELEKMKLKAKIVQPHTCGKSNDKTVSLTDNQLKGFNKKKNR